MVTIYGAPAYAVGSDEPADAPPRTWKPVPAAFGDFAQAVAARYSGSFAGLPRVRYFEAWNEPNLSGFLTPQYVGTTSFAPDHYRLMLNSFYAGIKEVHADNVVIAGGLAPYGDVPGSARTRPLFFFRELLCLDKRLRRENCDAKPRFDILAHHPINTSGGPRRSAVHPDDVSTPDLKHVRRTLRAAERAGTIAGDKKRHQLWATELWWETNPPETEGSLDVGLRKHARWIAEALYVLWKQGAKVVINLPLRDLPRDPARPELTLDSGLIFSGGDPKPGFQAFRFPFVTERKSKQELLAWGKAPAAGSLEIERRVGGGWKTIKKVNVGDNKLFTARLRIRGKAKLRAIVAGEQSLVWSQRR